MCECVGRVSNGRKPTAALPPEAVNEEDGGPERGGGGEGGQEGLETT